MIGFGVAGYVCVHLCTMAKDILTVDRSGIAVPLVYPASITNRRIQSNQAASWLHSFPYCPYQPLSFLGVWALCAGNMARDLV